MPESPESLDREFPGVPQDATEKIRIQMHDRALRDLYFLCEGVLGYTKLTPHTHGHLCRFLETCNVKRRMVQMPRSHFKTTISTIGHTIQLILRDPNVRILVVAAASKNAERFLQEIKNHFTLNARLKWLFPEIVPENTSRVAWNAQEMTVNRSAFWREPTVDTIGARGAVESRHYDWIKADDIIGEKEYNSDSEMEKTIEWSSGLESLLNSELEGRIDFIGTRWRMDDVYAFIEEFYGAPDEEAITIGPYALRSGELALFRREAIEESEPIFPEHFSKDFFIRLQRERPERYAAQYANNPRAAGVSMFEEGWLRYYRTSGTPGEYNFRIIRTLQDGTEEILTLQQLDRMALFDPAVGERKRGRESTSRPALLMTGQYKHDIFILDTEIRKRTPDYFVEKIFEWDKVWQPRFFSIEKYGYQGSIKYTLRQLSEARGIPYPSIREWPPQGVYSAQMAKDERIKGLQPLFREGRIWVREGFTEFLDEYLFYPRGKFRDALDALAQGVIVWGVSWNSEELEAAREREEKILGSLGPTGYFPRKNAEIAQEWYKERLRETRFA